MRKSFAVILLLIILAGVVTGCSGQEEVVEVSAQTPDDDCVVVEAPDITPGAAQTCVPATPTPEPTPTPTATPTPTPVQTTPEPTPAPTAKQTAAPTTAPTQKSAPTATPSPTAEPIEALNYIPGYVNSNGVNMRKSPNTYSQVLEVYSTGKNLYITGRNSEWYRVEADGMTGYIAKRFITLGVYATPKPTQKPTATPTAKPTATPSPVPDYYTVYAGEFSESDIVLVAKLLTSEGPGSTQLGLRAIASVVLNRVKNQSGNFPNTVYGVIYQKGQFYPEGALDGITPTSSALTAARYVFSEHGATLPKKVLFYKASYLGTSWYSYLQYYCTIEANNYFLAIYGY